MYGMYNALKRRFDMKLYLIMFFLQCNEDVPLLVAFIVTMDAKHGIWFLPSHCYEVRGGGGGGGEGWGCKVTENMK